MQKKVKFVMIIAALLLLLATINAASAANVYTITDTSYSNYFDASGDISNANIQAGDVLDCSGEISNKDMNIDIPLSITSSDHTAHILEGTITILPDGSGTSITGLAINNANKNGIIVDGANGNTISNNNIMVHQNEESYGIYLIESENNQITGNTITTTGDTTTYGVYLECSSFNMIQSNTINTTGFAGDVDWSNYMNGGVYSTIGLFLYDGSNNNNVANNTINTNYNTTSNTGWDTILGARIYKDSSGNSFTGNTITTNGYSYGYGLEIVGSSGSPANNNTITNNTINTTGVNPASDKAYANGIKVDSFTDNTVISGNQINATAPVFSYGVYLENLGGPATLKHVTVTGNTITATANVNYVIELWDTDGHTISNNVIRGVGNYSMGIGTYSSGNNNINHNTITTIGDNSAPTIPNADAIPASNEGIKLYKNSNQNTVEYNTINSADVYAVNTTESSSNIIRNNYLYSDNGNKQGDTAVTSGTGDTVTDNYGKTPTAGFIADKTSGNAPLSVQFTDQSTGTIASYAWDFTGDGTTDSTAQNPTNTYNTPGTYTVKLTVTGPGGGDDETKTNYITVNTPTEAPVAEFTADETTGNAPLTVQFTDTSTGTITTYKWDFNNDGTVDCTLQNPTNTYDTPGTYTVKLTVTGPDGTDTETKTSYITINTHTTTPIAAFTADKTTGNAPLTVQFTDTSTGTITTYKWDFTGDGTVDCTLQNPTNTYDTPGTYTVKLTITGPDGSDEETKTNYITVNTPTTAPVANFTTNKTTGNAPLTVQFTDTSTGTITTYKWDFNNDGTVDCTLQNPTNTYDTPGTYTVKLTVTGPDGTDTETKTSYITINTHTTTPIAAFTADKTTGNAPLTVQFTDTSTGTITTYKWDFTGDGTVDCTLQNPTNTYDTPGTYTVKLTITGPDGSDEETKTNYITVNTPTTAPVANFTTNKTTGNAPLTVQFTDTSTGTITTYKWDFNNDGTVDCTLQNPTNTYDTPGTYTVKLTITGPDGSDEETKTNYITVNTPTTAPVANFTTNKTTGNAPLTVQFTDTSTGTITTYKWDFTGDGTVDCTLQNPTNTYDTPGTYTVKLTITGPDGSDEETKTNYITVNTPTPSADVYVHSSVSNSTPQTGENITMTFKIGNNGPNTAENVLFTYVVPDNFEFVSMTADAQPNPTYNQTTRTITWNLGDVPVGDPKLNVVLKVLDTTSSTSNPTITSTTNDPVSGNNNPSITVNEGQTSPNTNGNGTETNETTNQNTIPMQTTGTPLTGLIIAILTLFSGIALTKKQKNIPIKKPLLLFTILTLTLTITGTASATNVYNITDDSYSSYFNETGYITNNNVQAGDVLDLSGTIKNKNMYIDRPLNITSTDKTAKLRNGTITILTGGSGTNVTNLNIVNSNENGSGIFLYETENNTIQDNYIHCNGPFGFAIPVTRSHHNKIIGNTVIMTQRSDTVRTHTAIPLGESNYNTIADNYIKSDGANCIYLSYWGSGNFESNGLSYHNEIINNTCIGVDTSWCYAIQMMGSYNTAKNNTILSETFPEKTSFYGTGAYRGISSEMDEEGGNTIIGNTISATFCGIYATSKCIVSGNTVYCYQDETTADYTNNNGISAGPSCSVTDNTINMLYGGYGLYLTGSNCEVTGNNIKTTGTEETICLYGKISDINISNNIINSKSTGILLKKQSSSKRPTNTLINNNQITTTSTHAINSVDGSNTTITNNYLNSDKGNKLGNDAINSGTNDVITGNYGGAITAAFTTDKTTGDAPLTIQFTDQSTGTISNYAWDFDNNGTTDSTDKNPTYTYTQAGQYTVKLTVTGSGGGDDEVKTDYINVIAPAAAPVANFTTDKTTGNAPLTVQFTDQSTGTVTSYKWDFDNNGTVDSTSKNPTYTFSTIGNYTVKLTVTGSGGSDDEVKTNYINVTTPAAAPVANFTADKISGNAPLTVQFTDQSTGTVTSYKWDFDNNGTVDSTSKNPTYTFSTIGNYTVKLTVTGSGGSDDEVKTNYINVTTPAAAPVANFTTNKTTGNAPLTVQFTDQSTGTVTSYKWDFDNNGTVDSTSKNPTYTFSTIGNYTVKLTVTGSGGSDDEVKTNYINATAPAAAPVANFTTNKTTGNAPLTVQFTDTSTGTITTYKWDFTGDGTVDCTLQNPTNTYDTPGTYTVKLTITGPDGSDEETKTNYITVNTPTPSADVYVHSSVSNSTPQTGENITMTFKIGNNGPNTAENVLFTYVVPDNFEFVSMTADAQPNPTYNQTTRTITWNLGDVPVGDPKLNVVLKVLDTTSSTSNPTITSTTNDPVSGNNNPSITVNEGQTSPNTNGNGTETNETTNQNTIPMQTTGTPLTGLIIAILTLFSGIALTKKQKNIPIKKPLLLFTILTLTLTITGTASATDTVNETMNTMQSANSISGTVFDAYDNSTGDYVGEYGDAVPVANATVKLRSQSNYNQIITTTTTDSSGNYVFSDLAQGDYAVEFSYRTYKNFLENVTLGTESLTVDCTFVPDIAIISYYGTPGVDGQLNKMQALMDLSCRVYTIDSYNLNRPEDMGRHWMLEYANFILVDMYSTLSPAVSAEEVAQSPANKNHRVAYVFGVYDESFIAGFIPTWNFLGGTVENNTYNTLENTYIGSYWQAEVVKDNDTVKENMKNMLDYIFYLLGDSDVNPTEIVGRTPLLPSSTWGIYHSDYGVFGVNPTQEDINEWILADPGYNDDKVGSLNWMTNELKAWSAKNNDPSEIYEAFENWYNSTKPNITSSYIVIASYYPGGTLVDAMIRTYESQGRSVFNLFQSATDPPISEFLKEITIGANGNGPLSRDVVAVNSLYSWSMYYTNMGKGGAIDSFTAMNIEIIRAVNSLSQYSYTSDFGPQAEWTYSVTIPEFEGVFGAIPVSYVDSSGNEIPVQEGIDKVVELTNGWANLKEKANEDKRIAVILYNYPPGKTGLGASYLDIFQSLHDLLENMSDAGYDIGMAKVKFPPPEELYTIIAAFGNKGTWAQGLLDSYVEENYSSLTSNNQLVDLNQYIEWFNQLPKTLQNQLVAKWGDGIGEIMTYKDEYIVIPGFICGNIFITVQPSRGWEEVENYHDPTLPPHQQYVTFYKWIDEVFKADAMIHMGTHGTLEWLPGRSIGLQADDWTFQLSTIPSIYPYITSDPGEGMVAKERSFAMVISHMTPATVSSGLYGDLVTLHDYIHSYNNAVKVDAPELVYEYKIKIEELAVDLGFDTAKEGQTFENWLEEIHLKLHELENDVITLGLHNLGHGLEGNALIQETITIASSRTEILNNIKELLYPSISMDYYKMLEKTQYEDQIEAVKYKLNYYVTELVNGKSLDDLTTEIGIDSDSALYANLNFCLETISDLKSNIEMESIMNALSGGYIKPGLAADPSYSDVLPTGTSMYSLDTTRMPSKAAWEAAKKIVDKQLVEYYQEHGEFPDTIALVMWGTELLRTEGIGIAQFLYYLGVTPKWSITGNGVVTGIYMMDPSKLTITLDDGTVINRPRIDVLATAVTSNVDWLELMTDAVALVNAADESTDVNFVKKHYAENQSLDRIFGLPGAVLEGTGVSDLLPNTAKWENSTSVTAELAEVYLSRISNAWTVNNNNQIVVSNNRDTFEYLLKNTDLVTQNIDSTWRFLDSSDYYDWFGGLVLASQYLGANPDTSVVDIRDKNNIMTRSLSDEINFEIRSMVLNPTYQDALLGSASGWLEYAARYENLFAFDLINKNTDGTNLISDSVWNQLADNLLSSKFDVNADYKAVSFQSMAGWLITAERENIWNADSKTITQLADKYITAVNQYGVTCCHHTCANLNFNNFVVMSSSLTAAQLQQFAATMLSATGQTVTVGSTGETPQSGGSQPSSSNSNGQSVSAVGDSGDSAASPSKGSSESSKAHEITQASSSSSNSNSSTPLIAIIGVICLLCLIGVGYFRESILEQIRR